MSTARSSSNYVDEFDVSSIRTDATTIQTSNVRKVGTTSDFVTKTAVVQIKMNTPNFVIIMNALQAKYEEAFALGEEDEFQKTLNSILHIGERVSYQGFASVLHIWLHVPHVADEWLNADHANPNLLDTVSSWWETVSIGGEIVLLVDEESNETTVVLTASSTNLSIPVISLAKEGYANTTSSVIPSSSSTNEGITPNSSLTNEGINTSSLTNEGNADDVTAPDDLVSC
jgi:hypothetical protein